MTTPRLIRFMVRGRSAAVWTADNEVLLDRELGLETDTRKFKFGDGTTAWNSLPYAGLQTVNNANWSGADLEIANGGTGASSASAARSNLGLGSAATMDGPSGDLVGTTDLQSLSNKILDAPLASLPVFEDNAAAVTGGLAPNAVYATSAGEVRIRV